MPTANAASDLRRRRAREGVVRVEVALPCEDSALGRSVARALNEPERGPRLRKLRDAELAPARPVDLKALLASAPLDGIEIERSTDSRREIDL